MAFQYVDAPDEFKKLLCDIFTDAFMKENTGFESFEGFQYSSAVFLNWKADPRDHMAKRFGKGNLQNNIYQFGAHGWMIIVLGLLAPVGNFFATIPPAVGYGATMVIFALIFSQGISQFQKSPFTNRESLIVGISIIIGAGVMFLPSTAFVGMPDLLRYIVSNGLVDGFLVCFLLDQFLLRNPKKM